MTEFKELLQNPKRNPPVITYCAECSKYIPAPTLLTIGNKTGLKLTRLWTIKQQRHIRKNHPELYHKLRDNQRVILSLNYGENYKKSMYVIGNVEKYINENGTLEIPSRGVKLHSTN